MIQLVGAHLYPTGIKSPPHVLIGPFRSLLYSRLAPLGNIPMNWRRPRIIHTEEGPSRLNSSCYFCRGKEDGFSGDKNRPAVRGNYSQNDLETGQGPLRSNNDLLLQFTSHLDRLDRNWRNDPFWRDLYPRWAEPIFKDGIDVKTNITNDNSRFTVEMETHQFRPEELQVKTMDDTLLVEGRHEDVKDRDNYTRMYFVRKYQLPPDVDPQDVSSSVDSRVQPYIAT